MSRTLFAVEFNSCPDEIRLQTNNERKLEKRVQLMEQRERTLPQLQHYENSGIIHVRPDVIMIRYDRRASLGLNS